MAGVTQAERDAGQLLGLTTDEPARLKQLEWKAKLKRAHERGADHPVD